MRHETTFDESEQSFQQKLDFSTAAIQASLELGESPIVTTKFATYSVVLLHMTAHEFPSIPVVWIDTGFNSEKTHEYAADVCQLLKLNLKTYMPAHAWKGAIPPPESSEHARFVEHTKLEPFNSALEEISPDVWFSSLRSDQTHFRGGLRHFQKTELKLLKVSPLLTWNTQDLETYLQLYNLPIGVEAIDPTKPAPHLECGLHPHFS